MKNQTRLTILVSLVVTALTLVGCSDYDNGFTEKVIKFQSDFTEQFGSFDAQQDWNLAERASVTVITTEVKDVNVYTEKDGIYVQVGAFRNVSGTRKLEFDVIEKVKDLVVSDGEVALRAYVGGTVNFDEHTSVEGQVMETRGGEYVNRNMWARDYRVPGNITEAEYNAVVAAFSKPHYGAYNNVLVPWTQMFVQQVHKGTSSYYDGYNQVRITASDFMNRLMMWDNSAPESAKEFDNGYIHVNDFNAGNQSTEAYDDYDTEHQNAIIGMTMMRGIDPTNCPTETVKDPDGNDVVWVKQFMYHNSTSNEYQPTYIMKEVTWEEDGETKSGLYLGFDFLAEAPEDQQINKNMDVRRDWIFNDWIIKVSQALEVGVPLKRLDKAKPTSWILAGEDLGGGYDIDYNDVVVQVEYKAGEEYANVTPLAAGGTLASYLFFENGDNSVCIGEIHQLLGAPQTISGQYSIRNMSNAQPSSTSVKVRVGTNFQMSEDISLDNNMGGFTIKVLPAGADPVDPKDPDAFRDATVVSSPQKGEAPFIICVPFSFTLANVPAEGQKTTSVWSWPGEMTNIATAYDDFEYWVADHTDKTNWYAKPNPAKIVSTKAIAAKYAGAQQPEPMEDEEIADSQDPNLDRSFISEIPEKYPVREVPTYSLALKEGVTEINLNVGETFDMLDYITTTYPNDVYCTTEGASDLTHVEGSKTEMMGSLGGRQVIVTVRLDDPSGQKTLEVPVNILADAMFMVSYYDYHTNTTTNLADQEIDVSANSELQIQLAYEHASSATITADITDNGSGSTASVNDKILTVKAGSVKDKKETITVNFDPDGYYQSASATFTINVTAAEIQKQASNLNVQQNASTTVPTSDNDEGIDLRSLLTTSSTGNITYRVIYNDENVQNYVINMNPWTVNGAGQTVASNAHCYFRPNKPGTLIVEISQAADDNYYASDVKTCTLTVNEQTVVVNNDDFGTEIQFSSKNVGSQWYSTERKDVIDLSQLPTGTYQITQVYSEGVSFTSGAYIYFLLDGGSYYDVNNGNSNAQGSIGTSSDGRNYTTFTVSTSEYKYFVINYNNSLGVNESPEAVFVKSVSSSAKRRVVKR